MPRTTPDASRVELAALLALGRSQAEAARRLGIARSTVRKLVREPQVRGLVEAFRERVEVVSLDLAGLTVYRSAALLAEMLEQELARVRAGEGASIDLRDVARIHRDACESQRSAAALALLGGSPGAPVKPAVPVDTRDPDDPRPQAESAKPEAEPARDAAEWLRRFGSK